MVKIYKESEFSFKIRSQAAREINFGDMVDQSSNMEVPHGIPTTRRTFKDWRESRERQRDFARATTTPRYKCDRNGTGT